MQNANVTTLNFESHAVSSNLFRARELAGPLAHLEICYRVVCQSSFNDLVWTDDHMENAHLTAQGTRWLAPVIHAMHGEEPLPVTALDWITVYHQARELALSHFHAWSRSRGFAA